MGDFFGVILRMSLTASAVIVAVLLVRLLLRRAPRRYSYLLWLIVLVRLVFPTALQTEYGLIPDLSGISENGGETAAWIRTFTGNGGEGAEALRTPDAETNAVKTAGAAAGMSRTDAEEAAAGRRTRGADGLGRMAEEVLGWTYGRGVSRFTWNVVGWCYLAGALGLAIYGAAGYAALRRRLNGCDVQKLCEIGIGHERRAGRTGGLRIRVRSRIRLIESEEIGAPFTVGLVSPIICLPKNLSNVEREMVLAHERMHIRRKDQLIKLAAYAVRSVHWFNPLVWIAFFFFEEDMEVSCDEAALRSLGYERRKDYAKTLLAFAGCGEAAAGGCSMSFGKKNAKSRIRSVLSAKQAKAWVSVLSAAAVVIVAGLLLVNRSPAQAEESPELSGQAQDGTGEGADVTDAGAAGMPDGTGGGADVTDAGAADMPDGTGEEAGVTDAGAADAPNRTGEGADVADTGIAEVPDGTGEGADVTDAGIAEVPDGTGEGAGVADAGAADVSDAPPAEEQKSAAESGLAGIADSVRNGTITEGGLCMEDSEHYSPYEVTPLDGQENVQAAGDGGGAGQNAEKTVDVSGGGLLCNPLVERQDWENRYAFPLSGSGRIVTSQYGTRLHPVTGAIVFHAGIDFSAEEGEPVLAAADGVVYRTGTDADNGNYIILLHENGEVTYYAHCAAVMEEMTPGTVVSCGDRIAAAGNTGKSTGTHLHFAVSFQGAFLEPRFGEGELGGTVPPGQDVSE